MCLCRYGFKLIIFFPDFEIKFILNFLKNKFLLISEINSKKNQSISIIKANYRRHISKNFFVLETASHHVRLSKRSKPWT